MTNLDKKEILNSGVKSIFGAVPFVGTALNELFFDYNSNIKQKRLNNFVEMLSEHFTNHQNINLENIKTEDFNDLFESVLIRVVKTKSEKKLHRFKNILIKELQSPTETIEYVDLYLDLITSLSEEELIVLYHHKNFDKAHETEVDYLNNLNNKLNQELENKKRETIIIGTSKYQIEIDKLNSKREPIIKKHKILEKYRDAKYYSLDDKKFFFFKQRLYSKGLLYDSGLGGIGVRSFEIMNITEFGNEFIDFIMAE